jgi:subtilisin family serine protease
MAAPHAAGLAALILDADPSLTHREVFWSIVETAEDLDPPGKDNEYGWGLIQCLPAIDYALEGDFPEIWCPTMEPPGTDGE